MHSPRSLLACAILAVAALPVWASCPDIKGQGDFSFIGNSFPAVTHVARQIEACARPGLKVAFKITPQARATPMAGQNWRAKTGFVPQWVAI